MNWHYAKGGERHGPVSFATLRSMIVTGEVAQTDLVWREGMADWLPAGEVSEISGEDSESSASSASSSGGDVVPKVGGESVRGVGPVAHERIPNYLLQSILVTLLCGCFSWPFGIPAIVFASKVDGFVARGDISGAIDASRKAKTWMWIALGIGILSNVLAAVFFLLPVWVS
jgi:hypothetical protein